MNNGFNLDGYLINNNHEILLEAYNQMKTLTRPMIYTPTPLTPRQYQQIVHRPESRQYTIPDTVNISKKRLIIPSISDEGKDSKTTDEVSQCKVCNDNRSICLMRPCKHLCMCVHCTRIKFKIDNKCIICRTKVQEIDILFQ